MHIEFLGTGTSQGIPVIGCDCHVCNSKDKRDSRTRTSALIHTNNHSLLIDAGPDLRLQLLNSQLPLPTALLLTHAHQDHTGGLDDLRPLIHMHNKPFPIFAEERVLKRIKQQYAYAFETNPYPGAPRFDLHPIDEEPFTIENTPIIPIHLFHGELPILGFRIGHTAYLTDVKTIPEKSMKKLEGVHTLVLNALRHKSHHSHLTLEEAINLGQDIGAKQTFFTHISHHLGKHSDIKLPPDYQLAYDKCLITSK
ncbi:MAG: MBL fold metallo-hydrolase [Cryomorphaceae bacterium]|nr:MBL fold metallo-hydrolase [Cryomorphaceae bacterium]